MNSKIQLKRDAAGVCKAVIIDGYEMPSVARARLVAKPSVPIILRIDIYVSDVETIGCERAPVAQP